jgi:hypothetical protein
MSLDFRKNNLPAGLSMVTHSAIKNEMMPQCRTEVLHWEKKKAKEQLLLKSVLPINPAVRNKSLGDDKETALAVGSVGKNNPIDNGEELGTPGIDSSTAEGIVVKDEIKPEDQLTITTPPNSIFEIRLTPCKGYSIFAKAPVPRGTLVLAEKPLLRVTKAHYLAEDVEEAIEGLNEEDRKKYWSLASAHGQDSSRCVSFFDAN